MAVPLAFEYPNALVLLVLLPLAWWVSRRSLSGMSKARRRFSTALRFTVLLLLILAAAGLQQVLLRDALCVFYLVDTSDSISAEATEQIKSFINRAMPEARSDDRAGIIAFGGDALLDALPVPDLEVKDIHSVPSTSHTDIAQATRLALAAFPAGVSRRIVLFSDGNETLGNAVDEAAIAKSNNVAIDVVPLGQELQNEVLLHKMTVPPRAKRGEPVEVELIAESLKPVRATVELWRNDQFIAEYGFDLKGGHKERIPLPPQTLDAPGFYTFEAHLKTAPANDTIAENNHAAGFTRVQGEPNVLLVSSNVDRGHFLASKLEERHIRTRLVQPSALPVTLADLAEYDSVLLDDVNAVNFTVKQMRMFEGATRDLGIGLGMIGGEDSFGLGGYYKTPIEAALPVDMDVKQKKHFPATSVVVVIDQSGSMSAQEDGKQKIQMASEAACLVTDLLTPRDELGVIACDTASKEVLPLTKVEDPTQIKAKIRTLRGGGGGIFCYTGLMAAKKMLANASGRIRHVIMLVDGNDAEQQEGCRELAAELVKDKITVTCVSIGEGVHSQFLHDVAMEGKGRFYIAQKMAELPRIYTKETFLVARSLVVEEPFRPIVADPSDDTLRGVDWDSTPPLLGYVGTTAKGRAATPLLTHKGDPLFSRWQYGLGRSIAFTSDATNRWAARWLQWDQFGKLWAQWVRWSLRPSDTAEFDTTVTIERGRGMITVDAINEQNEYVNFMAAKARLLPPDMQGKDIELAQTAPGRYQATFDARDVGVYMVNVTNKDEQGRETSQTTGATVPYPDEYKDFRPDTYLLSRLADLTGGRTMELGQGPQVFSLKREPARTPVDLWPKLVLLAALLFVFDVAIRRVMIERQQIEAALARVRAFRDRLRRERELAPDPTLGRLIRVKRRGAATAPTPGPPLAPDATPDTPSGGPAPPPPTPSPASSELRAQLDEAIQAVRAGGAPPSTPEPVPGDQGDGDTVSRLLAAKRRARKG